MLTDVDKVARNLCNAGGRYVFLVVKFNKVASRKCNLSASINKQIHEVIFSYTIVQFFVPLEFDDNKGVITICKSKHRKQNGRKKKNKRTNFDIQIIHINYRSSNTNHTENQG